LDVVVLDRAGIKNARAVILALESDSTAIFVTTVVRNFAPEVPILASADLVENVSRIQKVGADYVLSISQVMVQIMTKHVLGDSVSQQPGIKLVKVRPAKLTGKIL
jgi:voltage-gated potassium channel Kch